MHCVVVVDCWMLDAFCEGWMVNERIGLLRGVRPGCRGSGLC